MDTIDCCHVGFFLRTNVLDGMVYDGALCLMMEVFSNDESSHVICEKWHNNKRFMSATVISQLNDGVRCKVKAEGVKVVLVKWDYVP
jgi:hypothetical protein